MAADLEAYRKAQQHPAFAILTGFTSPALTPASRTQARSEVLTSNGVLAHALAQVAAERTRTHLTAADLRAATLTDLTHPAPQDAAGHVAIETHLAGTLTYTPPNTAQNAAQGLTQTLTFHCATFAGAVTPEDARTTLELLIAHHDTASNNQASLVCVVVPWSNHSALIWSQWTDRDHPELGCVYVDLGERAIPFTSLPTNISAVPQSSTTHQLLGALTALDNPTVSNLFTQKVSTNQGYTLAALAGLGLVERTGQGTAVLRATGRHIARLDQSYALAALNDLVADCAMARAYRRGGRASAYDLLCAIEARVPGDKIAPAAGTWQRRAVDIKGWASARNDTTTPTGDDNLAHEGTEAPEEWTIDGAPGSPQRRASMHAALLARLAATDPLDVEVLVANVLEKLGYTNMRRTPRSGDGGIDLRCNSRAITPLHQLSTIVQVKRQCSTVGNTEVLQLRGAASGRAQVAMLVTTSSFSPEAIRESRRDPGAPILLVNGDDLATWCLDHSVGVHDHPVRGWEFTDFTVFNHHTCAYPIAYDDTDLDDLPDADRVNGTGCIAAQPLSPKAV